MTFSVTYPEGAVHGSERPPWREDYCKKTYLVFESALLLLFSISFMCRSTYISIEKFTRGSFLCIRQICSHCSNTYIWESHPYVGKIPAGNIMISAAILYTGLLPAKALRVFSNLNCATFTRKTFFRHQKAFLPLAINCIWDKELEALINQLQVKKQGLVLGGDGRADSPGHSAKYGSYGCGSEAGPGMVIVMLYVHETQLVYRIMRLREVTIWRRRAFIAA